MVDNGEWLSFEIGNGSHAWTVFSVRIVRVRSERCHLIPSYEISTRFRWFNIILENAKQLTDKK